MLENNAAPLARRRARWFRWMAFVALVAGIVLATAVYETALRSPDILDDPEMTGFNRQEVRQMGLLYGRQGVLIHNMTAALQDPATQAFLILVIMTGVAGGCWYVAVLLDVDGSRP